MHNNSLLLQPCLLHTIAHPPRMLSLSGVFPKLPPTHDRASHAARSGTTRGQEIAQRGGISHSQISEKEQKMYYRLTIFSSLVVVATAMTANVAAEDKVIITSSSIKLTNSDGKSVEVSGYRVEGKAKDFKKPEVKKAIEAARSSYDENRKKAFDASLTPTAIPAGPIIIREIRYEREVGCHGWYGCHGFCGCYSCRNCYGCYRCSGCIGCCSCYSCCSCSRPIGCHGCAGYRIPHSRTMTIQKSWQSCEAIANPSRDVVRPMPTALSERRWMRYA